MLEVGSKQWAQALRELVNDLPLLREIGGDFSASYGLCFEVDDPDEGSDTRRAIIRIESGVVTDADEVDEAAYDRADVRLRAGCDAWGQVLDGVVEPLKAILLGRVKMDGDRLLLMRGLPSAKALIEAARELDAEFSGR